MMKWRAKKLKNKYKEEKLKGQKKENLESEKAKFKIERYEEHEISTYLSMW